MFTYYDTSSVAKKITEEILHKITQKKEITGIWLVLPTVEVRKEITHSQLATHQVMLENLAPFENEAAICLLNFDVVYLEIARRYFYQDSFTQKRFLIKYLSN